MTKVVVDQEARDKIKYELATNFLVEAGAGSGKTSSLVDRMVHLISTGRAEIQEIVAITFTRKAADELKVRFQSRLEEAWKKAADLDVEFRLSDALQNIDRIYLGTVHSFCAKLLRERPIEANLDLTFTELEEADDDDLLREAWQLHLQTLMDERPHLLSQMEELGVNVDYFFRWLKSLKEYSDVEWNTEAVPKPNLSACFKSFMNLLKEAKKCIPEDEPEGGYDGLQRSILVAHQKERFMNHSKEKDLLSIFELFNKNLKPTLKKWCSREDAKFYEEKITIFFEESIKPLIQAWKEYCHPFIIDFIKEAVKTYEQLKKERSLLNFQDLMLNTAKLLKENPEVRGYFQNKYRYLLVDEYQDTDPIQAEIMFYLTSQDLQEKNWTNCKPIAGSLFVVGDPKQAIYRFRRADIDTYNRVKQLIEEHGGEVLQLKMNFRTIDTVTKELNTVFVKHFPEEESVYQAAYRPLISFHEDTGTGLTGVKSLIVPADYKNKDEVILKDAENIAVTIQTLIQQGYNPKDFMVLTRYTDGIATYARTIEEIGIPVSISGEVVLGETREFQDLWILLKSFLDPTDEAGLVAALRGIFFGFSDNELYQWKQANGRFSIYTDIPDGLPPEAKEKFALALSKLKGFRKWIQNLTPSAAIEKIMEAVGFYPLLLINGGNRRTYKSLLQMVESLRKHEATGNTTYKHAIDRMTELIFEKTIVANMEEDADAVRVMNVHKAKGLEAPIVFLAHPVKQVNPENFLTHHIKREDIKSKGYFTFSIENGFQKKEMAIPLEWETQKQEELQYLTEEELRIIYVASTRAENALIISTNGGNKKNPWSVLLSMENIQEMKVPDFHIEASKVRREVTFEELKANTDNRLVWLERSKVKTYDHWTPTKDKDYSEIVTIEREAGGGKNWGSLIHDVFEKAVHGFALTNYIKIALNKYGVSKEREGEVMGYLHQFRASEMWNEIQNADETFTEVPFTLKVEKGHLLYSLITKNPEDELPIFVKGTIDLIFKKNGAWTVVDYKTDRAKWTEDYMKLQAFYSSQLSFYKHAWETLTGESVERQYLYFLEPNQWVLQS